MDRDRIRDWLISRVAEETGLDATEVRDDEPVTALGLDSPRIAAVLGDLQRYLDRAVDPTLAFEFPTIAALAARLALAEAEDVAAEHPAAGTGEAVAVVGVACRMPGAADAAAFWRLLLDGEDAVRDAAELHRDEPAGENPELTEGWAGSLDDVAGFDASFFRIPEEEALRMDPQQRLLLETTWEALEDAGELPARLRGSRTAVYVGVSTNDYAQRQANAPSLIGRHTLTGNALSVLANRVSYVFGLHGPSLAVDTACSSSLVAAHVAVRALRAGECDRALVAGVNLVLEPAAMTGLRKAGLLAADGRCKSFDAAADGYVRGEGCGVLVLKPLSAAEAAGDRVYAVIRGSAVNQDGASNGLTAPNPAAQRALLHAAYRDAGIPPETVHYVECHGTGTPLGDPVEARALGAVVGTGRTRACLIGSVKTNIGHLEAAAGVAGLLKVALALHHRRIPPSLHFAKPNPHIPVEELGLEVVTRAAAWPSSGDRRVAGVSSFGFGGTNAHVVLTGAPSRRAAPVGDRPLVLPVSARSRPALVRALDSWATLLTGADDPEGLVHTAAVRRTHHRPYRLAVVADDATALAAGLRTADGAQAPRTLDAEPRTAFVFSGQGTQYEGMARELLGTDALFRSVIRRCDEALEAETDWSLEAVLRGETEVDLADTAFAQPLLVAIQLGLAAVWRAMGIEPVAVIGHSVGELSAAVVAGVLDTPTAVRLAADRGRLMAVAAGGRMLGAGLSPGEAAKHTGPGVTLAAINGPRLVVLAGDAGELERVRAGLAVQGTLARWLPVGYAFHSPRMDAAARALGERYAHLPGVSPRIAFYSTVDGRRAVEADLGGHYWARNARQPVDFAGGLVALLDAGIDALLEIGPRPALRTALRQSAEVISPPVLILDSLRTDLPDRRSLLETLGRLYRLGCAPRWEYLHPEGARVASVPVHPWERQRFWMPRAAPVANSEPLLGTELDLADSGSRVWESIVDARATPALLDHRVHGAVVLPATAFVRIAVAAAHAMRGGRHGPVLVRDLELVHPLPLDGGPVRLQTTVTPAGNGQAVSFQARPVAGGRAWTRHATTSIDGTDPEERDAVPETADAEPVPTGQFYRSLAERGLEYGPAFRGVRAVGRGTGEATGELAVDADPGWPMGESVRLLDAAMQLVSAAVPPGGAGGVAVPVSARAIRWWTDPGRAAGAVVRVRTAAQDELLADVTLFDAARRPAIAVEGLRLRLTNRSPARADTAVWYYESRWRVAPGLPDTSPPTGRWLVFAGRGGVGDALAEALTARGVRVGLCRPESFDVDDPAAYERLLGQQTPAGVIFLWGLGPADARHLPVTAAVQLIRALSRGASDTTRVLAVTRGSQAVDEGSADVVAPLEAALWGLFKTVPLENPALRPRCVDLDPAADDFGEVAALLCGELADPELATEVAYRGDRRLVRRIIEVPASAKVSMRGLVRADGTYLVTGGTGGIGLVLAERLLARGARHLALLARGPASARVEARLSELRAGGARIRVVRADAGDRDSLAAGLAEVRAQGPPIRGLVHGAGVLRDGALLQLPASAVREVLDPKAAGGWHLHELTRRDPLEWFVLLASAAGVLGSPGQAGYAAANAVLDALAHHRRGAGLPAVSIDWGPWADLGMTEGAETGEQRRLRTASSAFTPEVALDVFESLTARGEPQTVVLPYNLRDLLQFYPTPVGASFFAELSTTEDDALKTIGLRPSARPQLGTPFVAPRTPLERRIAGIWRKSLDLDPIGVLDGFFEIGGDSVFGNQILAEVDRAFGVRLAPERAFQELTVAHLARLVEEQLREALDRITDEEAGHLLAELG
ncbi:type I polyketide synthase [Amycolatopsis magusensis]|uniref:type I polyketide synthase n=1 Tax=Amycolatopsis magusensis TaxID=882444 RepID=UPI0024A859CF|nr:type I polyketide synthase [Amycolatopsis magusensis]MDI5978878.1 SDR family NAD(P)-dependent oxidoreductase [Amycolatopsis magusensis]